MPECPTRCCCFCQGQLVPHQHCTMADALPSTALGELVEQVALMRKQLAALEARLQEAQQQQQQGGARAALALRCIQESAPQLITRLEHSFTSTGATHMVAANTSAPQQQPASVPMSTTRVVMHQIILPAQVDRLGICFGGQVCQFLPSMHGHQLHYDLTMSLCVCVRRTSLIARRC